MNEYIQMTLDMMGESGEKPIVISKTESGGGRTEDPRGQGFG